MSAKAGTPLRGSPGRCIWCNEPGGELRQVEVTVPNRLGLDPHEESVLVHPAHERSARDFFRHVTRNGKRFLLGVALVLVLVHVAAVFLVAASGGGTAAVLFGAVLVALAAWMWIFPFATPETIRWLGIRKAVVAVRVSALIVVGLGVWIAWMGVAPTG